MFIVCVLQEKTTFQQQFVPKFIPPEEEPQCREREGEEPPQAQVTQSRTEVMLSDKHTSHKNLNKSVHLFGLFTNISDFIIKTFSSLWEPSTVGVGEMSDGHIIYKQYQIFDSKQFLVFELQISTWNAITGFSYLKWQQDFWKFTSL